jgi:hypothetical protein
MTRHARAFDTRVTRLLPPTSVLPFSRPRTFPRAVAIVATTAVIAVVLVAITAATTIAANTVAVTPEQSVTVVGVFPSLKSVIEDVCRRAGVELRGFEAADREVSVTYNEVPLTTALAGLLRTESYLVGVTAGESGNPARVAWIRVVGSGDNAPRQATAGEVPRPSSRPVPTMGFEVPATFGDAEFSSEDPEQRARALHAIASRLIASKQVMSADPQALAATLQQYPHARELVTQLRDEQQDPDIRARLDQVLAALR